MDIDTSRPGQTMKIHQEQNTPCHHCARAPTAPARTPFTNEDGCLLQDIYAYPQLSASTYQLGRIVNSGR